MIPTFKRPELFMSRVAGDYQAPARYPSTSPYVIAAGGTMINRDASGNYLNQAAWVNTSIPCDPDSPQCGPGPVVNRAVVVALALMSHVLQLSKQRSKNCWEYARNTRLFFCCSGS